MNYIGNPDYRGYLAYKGSQGDANAQTLLNYVGNDGNFSNSSQFMAPLSADVNDANARYYQEFLNGGSAPGSGVGGSGAADTTGQDLAYLDDQEGMLRNMLTSAQRTREQGGQSIEDSYNKEKNRSDLERASAQQGFVTKREDTTNDKIDAIGRVNTGARTLADSVRRMLGAASGVNSSAYKETAPNAIARDASGKRASVYETSGRNLRDIDTAETSTMTRFDQYLEDLLSNKKDKQRQLEEGVLQQEQGIYRDMGEIARQRALVNGGGYSDVRAATAPSMAAINERQSSLDNLFNTFRDPFTAKPVEVSAPNLADYTVDRTALNANAQGGGGEAYSPYSSFLRKKFQTA